MEITGSKRGSIPTVTASLSIMEPFSISYNTPQLMCCASER
uniref:Uncharacterized protein n=1 Tax=Lepeophtheirus salmonis TaxID=72036 RepID=A0A0K2TG07_LEPSM